MAQMVELIFLWIISGLTWSPQQDNSIPNTQVRFLTHAQEIPLLQPTPALTDMHTFINIIKIKSNY